ncbi:hypothetical protein JOM56_005588 [Amanita muscaria]
MEEVVLHDDFNSSPFHPSDLINTALLGQNPDAKVALTHDDVWCDLMRNNFPTLNYATLMDIAQSYTTMIDEFGCISLEKISDPSNVLDERSHPVRGTEAPGLQESKAGTERPSIRVEGTPPELPGEGSFRRKTKDKFQHIFSIRPSRSRVSSSNLSQRDKSHNDLGESLKPADRQMRFVDRAKVPDILILKESVSFKAIHDSYSQDPTNRVHPGTRQYVLKRIRDWIDTPGAKERILWLYGPVGVGKSAIAQTIARSCAQEALAATFFFHRSDPGRNDGNRLCTTLAWQIAFSIPATRNALIHCLFERPDIPMKEIETQFEELIVKPLLGLKMSGVQLSAPVVIIDGVDECSDDNLQRRFLKIIGNAVKDDRVPLRFLICSRPEARIQEVIDIFQSLTLPLDLAELDDANQDIEKYLRAELSRIATEQDLDPTWPGEQIVQDFLSNASGQFGYASVVIRRLGDEYSSAETQLDIIRGLKPSSTISPFAELDGLYKEILGQQRDPVFLKDFLSLFIGRNGIKVDDLHRDDAMLLNVSEKELHRKLRGMLSLFKLKPYIDVHHRSFLDFLQDASRSGQYHISKQAGTRRYLDFIAGSLVRYASSVMERHDSHKTHFSPQFHHLASSYPAKIELPVEDWQEALQPLLDILPKFRSTWELRPCKECTGFRTIRDLLLHLVFRLEASAPTPTLFIYKTLLL